MLITLVSVQIKYTSLFQYLFSSKQHSELKISMAKYSLILYYLAKVKLVDDLLSKVWAKFENYLRFSPAETQFSP